MPLESAADEHYGDIRNELRKQGLPIGPNDMLIAAHARALQLTLVTNNTKECERLDGLSIENWFTDKID